MGIEIERKFLVTGDAWRIWTGALYRQGYLSREPDRTVRVRTVGSGETGHGYLTIKGRSQGAARLEFEYEIPIADAAQLLDELCEPGLIEKVRRTAELDGVTWVVDEFLGENAGLLLAEVELDADDQAFGHPAWLGPEVTGDPRYYNASLAQHPFSRWGAEATQGV